MRLLHTQTRRLEEFGQDLPSYAILSHRWGEEEVQFEDILRPDVAQMKGYQKLSTACAMSRNLGYDYLWMDTCCIDKSRTAEISETLNSMYTYFKSAGICIAYLSDINDNLEDSQWFTKGWTLTELIAPIDVLFVGSDWNTIGMKSSLHKRIAKITGIDEKVLLTGDMEGISIAAKMSWAAERQTSKAEDAAYSLMGIFGINMPINYGEGEQAFLRLQEEIMGRSNDQSIFAWNREGLQHKSNEDRVGLLAWGPECFKGMRDVVQVPVNEIEQALGVNGLEADFTLDDHAVRIRLPIQWISDNPKICRAFLACRKASSQPAALYAIHLHKGPNGRFSRTYWNNSDLIEVPLHDIDPLEISADDFLLIDLRRPGSNVENAAGSMRHTRVLSDETGRRSHGEAKRQREELTKQSDDGETKRRRDG